MRRPVVAPRLHEVLCNAGPELRERARAARGEMLRAGRWSLIVMAAMSLCFAVLCIREVLAGGPFGYPFIPAAFAVIQSLTFLIGWAAGRWIPRDQIRWAALGHDLCPSCGGDLAGLEEDAETGRVRCAACGAEWRRFMRLFEPACPGCGYDLSALKPDARGVTRCPECGKGWRVETGAKLPGG